MTQIDGTDVSGWQSPYPNYGNNKFVIVKATEGTGFTNPNHGKQVTAARDAGLLIGHYHYLSAESPEAQADHFFTVSGWRPGEIMACDTEAPFYMADPVEWTRRFIVQLKRHTGYPALTYINSAALNAYDWRSVIATGSGLWGAAYNNKGFGDTSEWPFVAIWQNSDRDETSGGDDNVFYGDAAAWKRYGGQNTAPAKPAPAPVAKPTPKPTPPRVCTVEAGDTLTSIAAQFGVPVSRLIDLNKLANPNLIYPGQKLKY